MSKSEARKPKALFAEVVEQQPTHRLTVDAGNPMTEVFVVDGAFSLKARGQAHLNIELPQGSYLVKYRSGDSVVQQWVNLSSDIVDTPRSPVVPTSSAPIGASTDWTPDERASAQSLYENSSLSVIVRDPGEEITPADDLSVRTPGGTTYARLGPRVASTPGWRVLTNAPVAGVAGDPAPGCYLVRVKTRDVGSYEMAVWVAPHYQTRVYLTRQLVGRGVRRRAPHLATASIQVVMPGLAEETLQHFEQLTEVVRSTLANERPIMPYEDIAYAVEEKSESPMLGLLGAHLLRLFIDRSSARDSTSEIDRAKNLYGRVLTNLNRLLPNWPDVVALSRGVSMSEGPMYEGPPMLWYSWSLIAPGADHWRIPPGSYASRIAPAIASVRPWLVWETSRMLKDTRESQVDLEQLRSTKNRLSEAPARTPIGRLIRQTPLEYFASIEELSGAWGMPQSSVSATLASLGEDEHRVEPGRKREAISKESKSGGTHLKTGLKRKGTRPGGRGAKVK